MTAPVITDDMRTWASAFVASVQNVAEMRGITLTPEYVDRITAEVRAEFLSAYRYDPSDDYDFARDEGDDDKGGEMADRASDREHKWMQGEA